MLPANAGAAPAQGQQHGVGRHGRVSYKRRFLVGIEETQPYIVIRAARREHEGDLGMRELACHGLQSGVALTVCVEHHRRRVAVESCVGKCVYLENAQGCLRSLSRVLHASAPQATLP